MQIVESCSCIRDTRDDPPYDILSQLNSSPVVPPLSMTRLQVFVDNHRAFHSLFEVMNEYEEIITSVMLQGTGFAELRVAMQKLHARFETFKPNAKPKYW
jgi:hypothetical protein